MIALAGRAFAGPFLLPLWSAPRGAGLYAVMVPGWRLLTFRALHFGQAEDFSARELLGPETPSLKAFMLAQALRTNKNER